MRDENEHERGDEREQESKQESKKASQEDYVAGLLFPSSFFCFFFFPSLFFF
jgi:hypothetical protein